MNPVCAKNLKTNYNVTPYGDHGTERVNHFSAMVVLWHHIIVTYLFEVW
jgi:hypothetical protein